MSEFNNTPTYLFQKTPNSIFYFRIAIPKDIQASLQGKELRLSLQTGLQSEAKRLSSRLSNECLKLFQKFRNYSNMGDQAQQQLTTEIIKKILKQKRKDFLKENDYQRAISDPTNVEEANALNNRLEKLRALMKESLCTNLHSGMIPTADSLLEQFEVEVDHSSENYKVLCRELLRLSINLIENVVERNKGDYSSATGLLEEALLEERFEIKKTVETSDVPDDNQSVLLTQIIKEYVDEHSHAVTEKSLAEYKSALNLFVEIVGDISTVQLNHSELRKYKSILKKLPPNKNKIRKYRDLTIDEIVNLELKKTLSVQTINNNITKVSQLLDWAKRQGYVSENYAQGLQIKKKKSDRDQRKEFSVDDLKTIFNPSIYIERTKLKNYKYWCPIIALLSGARLNEIAQLHLVDIKQENGTWVFDINDDTPDKQLKNISSKRKIPIHSEIMQLGFLTYIDKLKKKKEIRVFPELTYSRDGYGKNVGRWFGEYKTKIGISDPQKVFHSFRHTFINHLKQKRVDYICLSETVGHSVDGETLGRYGKQYDVEVLYNEIISKVEFEELNWQELKK